MNQNSSEDDGDSPPPQPDQPAEEDKSINSEEVVGTHEGKKPTAEEETVQDTFSAHIVIHQALHLPPARNELE